MNKKIIISIIIFIIVIMLTMFLINANTYCMDKTHRGIYPVNPYCTKCKGRDGIVQHECTNPNGIDKYCSSCGKIVKN